jgi:mono/diheme cytochrome c family protein
VILAFSFAPSPGLYAQDAKTNAEIYTYECGYCHLPRGTGTAMLGRRLGEDSALLAEREDLEEDYVRFVVRNGIVSMPALTRVEVTDSELDAIVAFLTGQD